ncbi:MAG: DUF6145 family protein [Lachnospiraceae bacterium]|nr:DUF6145 family protein [Lachnospiraceae bacterium]
MSKKDDMVICGANAYDKKYYFNPRYDRIPESIKEELHVICVLFTEEIGGIFTIEFEDDGTVSMRTEYAPEDYLYDEVGSGLLVSEVRRKRQELFETLSLYYRVMFLGEKIEDIPEE